jgi:multiple sugar transport system ATP-binding protein
MAGIVFNQVTKAFGDAIAVRDFSLEVADGEFLVLVGPSGCGKSTTLRMLAGLDEITSGTISIGGREVNSVPAKDRDIAMVFQTYALYPHMSVFDNMAFGLKLRGIPRSDIQTRVQQAAALLGIEDLLKRKPGQLSGGQRQRVALGRAIVREPAAFLLDEPLSNLDAKLRVQTRAEISRLHQRLGTTFVYVTHDQVEAMTMATRIAVMNEGVLQQVGSPQQLYDHPANVFVAGFIGSPAMNFFDGSVQREGERLVIAGDGLDFEVPTDRAALFEPLEGRALTFGMRPEHIHDPAYVPAGIVPAALEADVDITELMGNETFLHLKRGNTALLARVDPRTRARAGAATSVVMDLSHLRAFDARSGLAVALEVAAAA